MFSNWAGNVKFTPRDIVEVSNVNQLQELVRNAAQQQRKVRVVGSAHSFSPLIETNDILVSLKNGDLISVNSAAREATFDAGICLSHVGPLLQNHGLALRNQGDIDQQTLAGAMSTGTHGTGLEYASLACFITKIELVDGLGDLRIIDLDSPGDLLNAARVAAGTLGVMTKITLACDDSYFLRDQRGRVDLDLCLAEVPRAIQQNKHYEFFWFPYASCVQVKRCNRVASPAPRNRLIQFIADDVLERAFYGAACELAYAAPRLSRLTSRFCGKAMPTSDFSDVSFRVFPSSRHVRFNEMEYAVPLEAGVACFQEIRRFIEREQIQVFFPVEFRVSGPDTAWLSPMYGRPSAIISLHVYRQLDQTRYFAGAEAIFKRFGGRPHWGKVHHMSREELAQLYPRWVEFCQLRKQFDPHGIFLNSMLEKYFAD